MHIIQEAQPNDGNIPTSLKNIYNHIHSKIDNRIKQNQTERDSPSKFVAPNN